MTAQTPRVRMTDYKKFIFLKQGLSFHQKINVRHNILKRGTPNSERVF